jgi:hypothetical protein
MRTKRTQFFWVGAVIAATVLYASSGRPAAAQMLSTLFPEGVPGYDASPGVTVLSRLRPDTEPRGLHVGTFLVQPRLDSGFGYDDNVLASSPAHGSWLVRTQPSVLFTSEWSRDALGGYVSASDTHYLDLPAQDHADGTVVLGATRDIGRDRLTFAVAHVAQHQDVGQVDTLTTDRPVFFTLDNARVSYAAPLGRLTLTPDVEVTRWRFDDTTIGGLPASQAYRDRDVLLGSVTLRYDLAPLRSLVVVARAIGQHYLHTPEGQASEDSTGYQLLAGLDYDDNALWRYRLLVGGEMREFSAFQSHSAVITEAEITWVPTGLTTIRSTLVRRIEDAAQEGVSGFTYTGGKLSIDHEYLRNVLLNASIGLQQAAYLQGGQQSGYTFGLGATWLINQRMRLSATYDLTHLGRGPATAGQAIQASTRSIGLLTLGLGL